MAKPLSQITFDFVPADEAENTIVPAATVIIKEKQTETMKEPIEI